MMMIIIMPLSRYLLAMNWGIVGGIPHFVQTQTFMILILIHDFLLHHA